ncbi:Hypothetical protein LUCI_0802 [Lucifera butyrica]|uniref:Uncharacterized protein n=1 Tax=Lucifera butyrica TaxID=1351585 RepID=A0A498R5S9_9FIRM|nr:hypothetical protein [Lucifera butyrica]VBB05592.1 Hypothetical protein LUCI_0802 [Lucifera butyrica]
MNYLAEILAFSEWKEVNPLPASAIALWYELMAICNKAGWIQEFTVPNGLLQAKCSLSRKEFDHARSVLINFGRIKYKKSDRVNQAGKYLLVPFVQKGQQEGQQKGQQEGQRQAHTGDNVRGTLYKHKPKQNLNENIKNNSAREDFPVDNFSDGQSCPKCGGQGWYIEQVPFNNGMDTKTVAVQCDCKKKPEWALGS